MKTVGLIAEFNPLHYGHKYLINEIKKGSSPDVIVAAMSPNFVMRGEPAIFDKFIRTEHALNNGIDIVAEIPTIYAIQSADVFALKGVQILTALGCSEIYFGVETTRNDLLIQISKAMQTKEYTKELKNNMATGDSFSTSSKKSLIKINKDFDEILSKPNNLLAIEYLNAIKKLNSSIIPRFIKRVEAGYFEMEKKKQVIQSATALRELILAKKYKKYFTYPVKKLNPHVKNDYFSLIKYRIISSKPAELSDILGLGEGLENKLIEIAGCDNYEEALDKLVSKRNRETKISRILTAILLNIKKSESDVSKLEYIRVLGFNGRGQELLKVLNSTIPIITKIKRDLPASFYRELDFTKIYALPFDEKDLERKEYSPIIID